MIIPGTAQAQHRDTDNVTFTVKIDGKEVNMDPGGVISLSVSLELNRIPWARIILSDGSVENQKFEKADKDIFSPGKAVEILLGYDQKAESVFKGIIIKQSIKILTGRTYRLEIECRDMMVQTTLVKNSRYFYSANDTDIIKDIISNYTDLKTGKLEDSNFKHKELVQFNVTDWDFMLLRADVNGMFINIANGEINLAKPEVKAKADLQVQFGQGKSGISLLEFESELDARNHYPGVKGDSWDYSQQKVVEETAGSIPAAGGISLSQVTSVLGAGGTAKKNFPDVLYKKQTVQLYHGGDLDSQELTAWAESKQKRGELSRIKGRVAIPGIKCNPGDTLELNGISDRINGTHLIAGVVHQMLKGHWRTDIQFGWDTELIAEKLESGALASGLVAGISGLHAGVVSKIEGDTRSGNHRIQIRIPFIAQNPNNKQSDGIWARLVNIYAGDKRGFIFRPEIGDEVIVGFINNDPNDALVLGAVHSDNAESPDEIKLSDSNPLKGFIAKAGMQMLFDDDKNLVQLNTGGDNSPMIELDGKQKKIRIVLDSSNSIELSSSGVKVTGTRIDLN